MQASPDAFLDSLDRLSKKAGVLATVVLDRTTGAILNTSGSLISIRTSTSVTTTAAEDSNRENEGIEELAAMVWNFVNATKDLVQGLDTQVSKL
jgi:dynein light chain roadblock-type